MGKPGTLLKRIIDIIITVVALLICLPLFIIIPILIKLDSKGPAYFKQLRGGIDGKPFWILKFRAMVDGAENGPIYTQYNDPRITRVGKYLKRWSLDELPQLINVLKGEMSIIGPRPEIYAITLKFDEEQKKVFQFKPGITGISQINGRASLENDTRLPMEINYYSQANFWTDLAIFFKTFVVIVNNKGNIM